VFLFILFTNARIKKMIFIFLLFFYLRILTNVKVEIIRSGIFTNARAEIIRIRIFTNAKLWIIS